MRDKERERVLSTHRACLSVVFHPPTLPLSTAVPFEQEGRILAIGGQNVLEPIYVPTMEREGGREGGRKGRMES